MTGGSRGIGKAVARELASEGVTVAIVARHQDDLEATARELAAETGSRVVAIACDTGSDDSVKAMVGRAVAELAASTSWSTARHSLAARHHHPSWPTSRTTSSGPMSTSR